MHHFSEKAARDRAVLGALHPGIFGNEEPSPDPEGPPNFDGGVREPAPGPSDPVAEHNDLVADLWSAKRVSQGPLGWQVED
jgi:hypothetical protein